MESNTLTGLLNKSQSEPSNNTSRFTSSEPTIERSSDELDKLRKQHLSDTSSEPSSDTPSDTPMNTSSDTSIDTKVEQFIDALDKPLQVRRKGTLSELTKAKVLAMKKQGYSYAVISKTLKISRNTVYRLLKAHNMCTKKASTSDKGGLSHGN